jgi:enoyl-[acyl-carrier protein] reductase II
MYSYMPPEVSVFLYTCTNNFMAVNRVCQLLNIQYPIIQAGMIWCSGWELASAVSNAGGLGILGSGSMYPDVLRTHIQKTKAATKNNFGVNIPLIYPQVADHIDIIIQEKVPVVFSSAGSPKTWTEKLQSQGIKVVHVVSSAKFAKKSEEAGVDAVVAEGFEAGGHNGREETTTMVLIPMVCDAVKIPVIAAGGIGSGRQMAAAMALGAEAVQVGSLFAASAESSAHENFKNCIVNTGEGETLLTLKELTPVRLIKNKFYEDVEAAYKKCADIEELKTLLGRARAKKGMFEGDLVEGELEIGQVSGMINQIQPAGLILQEMWNEYNSVISQLK